MTAAPTTGRRRLVLVGGGHSQVEVLRRFGMDRPADAQLTLVTRDLLAPYSGMLPGYVAGHYTYREAHIDLRPLARAARCRLFQCEVNGVDLDRKLLLCPARPPIPFDYLSLNIGSRPVVSAVPGAAEYAVPAKPVDEFIEAWKGIQQRALEASNGFSIVIVGGGAGGVELALNMHYRLRTQLQERGQRQDEVAFHLIADSDVVLASQNRGVQKRITRCLKGRGVALHLGRRAVEVTAEKVCCDDGSEVPYNALIWVTQGGPVPWIKSCGLATDDRGFLLVDQTLRSVSHPFVFGSGDIATFQASPRPKSGVYAVRAGPYLAKNLRHVLRGEQPEEYHPQKEFLSLIGTGDKRAVASRGPWAAEGRLVWVLKDYIDRKFMRRYEMSGMMDGKMPDSEGKMVMQCAGCGGKLGQTALQRALARVAVEHGAHVVAGLGSPDDAAVVELPAGTLAVQSVDFFTPLIDDLYLFGRITANHCLNDLYAMGADAQSALAVVSLPRTDAGDQEDKLADLLSGAADVLKTEDATLVGGHTTEGKELTFGLSVNGYVRREDILSKTGMRPGDALILTKPLGTGVIFAADMQGLAEGPWLDGAVASMLRSNRAAADVFKLHGATACTDITGFGLMGHLNEMLAPCDVSVRLTLDAVPLLPGARESSAANVRSSLYPENARAEHTIQGPINTTDPRYALLFDPQTAGGLLASVPGERADACVDALKRAGYEAGGLSGASSPMNQSGGR